MLSILIPTYNYICNELVENLYHQAVKLNIPFEILLADDASTLIATKEANRKINELSNCKFIELEKNIGRSRIRNLLGEKAKYEFLIFMDCDAQVYDESFLSIYYHNKEIANVLVGGILNPPQLPHPNLSLRYYYEAATYKKQTSEKRNKSPYDSFTTFNFFIPKNIFMDIKFDESFNEYGHEDTLFGVELKNRNISVRHITNPLYHMGLEENKIYIEKVHTAIKSLINQRDKLSNHSRLFIFYNKIKKYKLDEVFLWGFKKYKGVMVRNLLSSNPNMKLFALYRLGYLCELDRTQENKPVSK